MSDVGISLDPALDASDLTREAQRRRGREAAEACAPLRLAEFSLAASKDRDPVRYVRGTHEERVDALLPLRLERMTQTPFAFFRGTAGLMAVDLAAAPNSGLIAQICGDAHANNVGLYGTDDAQIVMDINDFDETVRAPWEWDLKRLVVSIVLAGRESGASARHIERAARETTRAYRQAVKRLSAVPYDAAFTVMADEIRLTGHEKLGDEFERALSKARRNTSSRVVDRNVEDVLDPTTGERRVRFVDDDPVLFHVSDDEKAAVVAGLRQYFVDLRASRKPLLARYRIIDVAFRVVGTGSVGMRSYLALLQGNDDDWIVLHVKQAAASTLHPWLDDEWTTPTGLVSAPAHDGERIVAGARVVQARTDHLMGWTTIDDRPFIVRQFRNAKGSLDPLELKGNSLDDFARLCAAILARAHTRTLHPVALRAYLKGSKELDAALADYAHRYADQVEADHAQLVDAVAGGELG